MARLNGPRGESNKTHALTVTVDEKTRYMLDIVSSITTRSTASVITEAVINTLPHTTVKLSGETVTVRHLLDTLWSPFEAERFVLRAQRLPLRSGNEEKLWQLIQETDEIWKDSQDESVDRDAEGFIHIHRDVLRERFPALKQLASTIE